MNAATDCRVHWREGVNPRCLCRIGRPPVCAEGQHLAQQEAMALTVWKGLSNRHLGDSARALAWTRLRRRRARLVAHLRGEDT